MAVSAVKVYVTGEDILNKLSEEDRKRFNRAIITNAVLENDFTATITCVLVNDCPLEGKEYEECQRRYRYGSDGNAVPYKY